MSNNCYEVLSPAPGLWVINEGTVRMFLIEGESFALLIDTGKGGGELRSLVAELTPSPVRVLNTHKHFDHISCNAQFDFFYMHPLDAPEISPHCPENAQLQFLNDGDILDLGSRRLEIVHTPGHSAGCIALLDRENRLLFGSDNVGDRPIFTIFPDQLLEEYEKSLERIIGLEASYDKIYASHGSLETSADMARRLQACAKGISGGTISPEPTVIFDGSTQDIYRYQDAAILYKQCFTLGS